jgi:DNA-directed RNA polymerase subunit beta'
MIISKKIIKLEKKLLKFENLQSSFDYFQLNIASPKKIKDWANKLLPNKRVFGKIEKIDTINFEDYSPEDYGLFCEKIFGPVNDYKCSCGKYNGFYSKKICEICFVELTESRVRRYRMGYIELSAPIVHLWYLKGNPSYLSIVLNCINENINFSKIEEILYFKDEFNFIDKEHPLSRFFNLKKNNLKEILNYNKLKLLYSRDKNKSTFYKRSGTEIIKAALESINIKHEISKARSLLEIYSNSILKNKSLIKRIRILESFLSTKTNLSWMILTVLPVMPPGLRPFVKLPSGKLAMSAINEIYKLILLRNKNISKIIGKDSLPDLLYNQACKSLQITVDLLIENSKEQSIDNKLTINNKSIKSLTQLLEGKQGKFRQYLLGKRVDYSGRSVIVVSPTLKLNQCGIPYKIAVELFKPFLINEISKLKNISIDLNSKLINNIISTNQPYVWKILEKLMTKHDVLLNRAPTLHRFGIQSFSPVLTLTNVIYLHPLACTGFNADFDGDQMAVHLPLYESSQIEVQKMMRSSYNILSPSSGKTILMPSQEMIFGCYYLTLIINKTSYFNKKYFNNENSALNSFYKKNISIHTPILIHYYISNLKFNLTGKNIYFFNKNNIFKKTKIKLIKKYLISEKLKKYCLITTIGIMIIYEKDNFFELKNLFLETTPGRLIFSKNLKNKTINS